MNKNQQILLKELKQLDKKRVPFFHAKKELLKKGYSEQDIVHALYSFSYDGKPNAPKQHDPVTAYYAANPEEAERIANYVLENAKKSGYGRAAANYLASQYAPSPHARAKYGLAFADQIGYPYFTALLSIIPAGFLMSVHDLPGQVLYIGPIFVTSYWLMKKVWQHFR